MNTSMEKHLKNCEDIKKRDKNWGEILDFYNGSFAGAFDQLREIMNYLQKQIDESKKEENNG